MVLQSSVFPPPTSPANPTISFVNDRKAAKKAEEYVKSLSIKTPSIKQKVAYLSCGNQQKVAVAKWLAADCDVYIFDEPTKGVDVGAKQEIFTLINNIAKEGNCVIYATCENSELLSITDRMYVLFDGRITAELETAKTSEDGQFQKLFLLSHKPVSGSFLQMNVPAFYLQSLLKLSWA